MNDQNMVKTCKEEEAETGVKRKCNHLFKISKKDLINNVVYQQSKLIYVIDDNDLELFNMIIQHPSFDRHKTDVEKALFTAIFQNRKEMYHELIQISKDEFHTCKLKEMYLAAKWISYLKVVFYTPDFKPIGGINKTYLHLAARLNDPTILKELLNCKFIDVNSTDECGETPLIEAFRMNLSANIKELFKMVDLNHLHCNNEGKDALQILSNSSSPTQIKDKNEY